MPHFEEQLAVERLLEDETLTSDLVDQAARVLLDWGVEQVSWIAQQADGVASSKLDAHLATIRRAMKRISKRAGEAPPGRQRERVRALLGKMFPDMEGEPS